MFDKGLTSCSGTDPGAMVRELKEKLQLDCLQVILSLPGWTWADTNIHYDSKTPNAAETIQGSAGSHKDR